ncbi:MAG TPA: hypothetical protein VIX12_01720 [Candidatus Binataceae bacterium]
MASENLTGTVESVRENAQDTYERAKKTGREMTERGSQYVRGQLEKFDAQEIIERGTDFIRRSPWVAVGSSLAFGYLLGWVMRGRSTTQGRAYRSA